MRRDVVFTIDPDPDELERLDDLLTDAGFSPTLWSSPVVPSQMLTVIRPAVMVLALDPAGHGADRDLVARLRDDPATRSTPLVVITPRSHTIPDTLLGTWQPAQVVPRPVDPAELVGAVRRAAALYAASTRLQYATVPVGENHPSPHYRRAWPRPEPVTPGATLPRSVATTERVAP